jgi:hypothetical protein
MFDSNHDGQDDPTGNDDGGQGAPSAEPIVPTPIGSGMAAQVHPSAADRVTTAAPSGSGPPKKKRLVHASKRKQPALSDQVTTKLFPPHAPHCSLGLVAVKLVFGHLFEALQRLTQAAKIDASAGADTQPAKKLRALPMKRMLAPRYVAVLTYALLLVHLSYILMVHPSVGNLRLLIHRRQLPSLHLLHVLPQSLLLREWLIPLHCLLLRHGTIVGGQLTSWRA